MDAITAHPICPVRAVSVRPWSWDRGRRPWQGSLVQLADRLRRLPDLIQNPRRQGRLVPAVKYAPSAPDIRVAGWQESGKIKIAVSDDGIGMDAEDLPRLFQRYFRARTSAGIAGTGIGLNLVKQIVELHQGSIEVTSARGCGTTFTVTLPIAANSEAAAMSSHIDAA